MIENLRARYLVWSRVNSMVACVVLLKKLQEQSKIQTGVEWKKLLLKGRPCEMVVLWSQKIKQLIPQSSKTDFFKNSTHICHLQYLEILLSILMNSLQQHKRFISWQFREGCLLIKILYSFFSKLLVGVRCSPRHNIRVLSNKKC